MKELVVISGKGGTGKTSILAAFASLAGRAVLADCDVDAADLHLVLQPDVRLRHEFRAGHKADIDTTKCTRCGWCLSRCRFNAIAWTQTKGNVDYFVDPLACEGCGVCVDTCPARAIQFPEQVAGEWYESVTAHGPMVHARLGIAAENSGKLVTVVRQQARAIAEQQQIDLLLVDGPPGIGCPVIASITGASCVLIVTEPTLSGEHDLRRVAELARHFHTPACLCVNKWDINPVVADSIEAAAIDLGVIPVGRIRYDVAVTQSQIQGKSLIDTSANGASEDIRTLWKNMCPYLKTKNEDETG